MAVSIDWNTRIITIPKSDLVLVSGSLYRLDAEWFRQQVIDIMDSEIGIVHPDVFVHNTVVTLSGIDYARTIEIINGYTITFEYGLYAVLIDGANTNYLDVMNFNGVSVGTQNSGGLIYNQVGNLGDVNVTAIGGYPISSPEDLGSQIAPGLLGTDITTFTAADTMGEAIYRSKFIPKAIYVNTDVSSNGDGTQQYPFDNVNDAKDLVEETGINNIFVSGSIIVPRNLKNMNIHGIGLPNIDLNGQDVKNTRFTQCILTGNYSDSIIAQECVLSDGFELDGYFHDCSLIGDMFVRGGSVTNIITCTSGIPGTDRPTLSMTPGAATAVSIRGYRGGLTIKDCDQVDDVITVGIAEGSLTFDSSCTNGTMVARGDCKFIDETNGADVYDETTHNLIKKESVSIKNTVVAMS